MKDKIKLTLFANAYAITLTMLIYVNPNRSDLWIALEVIILPLIYYLGYEILMFKQEKSFEKDLDLIQRKKNYLEIAIDTIKRENKELKKDNKKLGKKLYNMK